MLTFMIFFMIFSLCTTTIKPNPQTHPYCTSPKNNSSSGNTLFTIGLNLIEITNNYHRKELSLAQKTIAVLTTHSSLPLDLLPLPIHLFTMFFFSVVFISSTLFFQWNSFLLCVCMCLSFRPSLSVYFRKLVIFIKWK